MKKATCLTDDQRWQSVLARDRMSTANSFSPCVPQASFAVLLPRQTCFAGKRLLLRKCQRALAAGFRPCKRCQPEKANAHNIGWIKSPTRVDCWNRKRLYAGSLSRPGGDESISSASVVKATTGMTPKAWQQAWRARRFANRWRKGRA